MQPDIPGLCAAIRTAHRHRVFATDQRKRADLALGAFLRTQLGWRKDLPAPERAAIAKRASAIISAAEDGEAIDDDWSDFAIGSVAAREPFSKIETAATKQMERLAVQLPVWESFG